MRLLTTDDPCNPKLEEHFEPKIPPYAMLSHTWGQEEVTFQDMQSLGWRLKRLAGWAKIRESCRLAKEHMLHYIWIDTCCINKTSSAELSEAINSMYKWYRLAKICFVHMADVHAVDPESDEFNHSRWFQRGWTLQELIAPMSVQFYTADWQRIGTKLDLRSVTSKITGIAVRVLEGASLKYICAAEKMSWASRRETTRREDAAYALMGLFDINMPLLYGEGLTRAFTRLQEEILRRTQDHTLFVWEGSWSLGGLLATAPRDFRSCNGTLPIRNDNAVPLELTHCGMRMELPTCTFMGKCYVALDCQRLRVAEDGTRAYARCWLQLSRIESLSGKMYYERAKYIFQDISDSVDECLQTVMYVRTSNTDFTTIPADLVKPEFLVRTKLKESGFHFVSAHPSIAWDHIGGDDPEFWISPLSVTRADTSKQGSMSVTMKNKAFVHGPVGHDDVVLGSLFFRHSHNNDAFALLVGFRYRGIFPISSPDILHPAAELLKLDEDKLEVVANDQPFGWSKEVQKPAQILYPERKSRVLANFQNEGVEGWLSGEYTIHLRWETVPDA